MAVAFGVPIEFPDPWEPRRLWAILALLGVLALAFAIEIIRRRRQQRARIRREWDTVRALAHEHGLSTEDTRLLMELIQRHAPAQPLRAVTAYRHFDTCVGREMARVAARSEQAACEELGRRLRAIRRTMDLDHVPAGQQIRSTRDLAEEQTLWAATGEPDNPRWVRLRVATVTEAVFHASAPDLAGALTVEPGTTVRFRIWREEDARYLFSAPLLRVTAEPPMAVFAHTESLQRIQSRAHFRIRYDQAAQVTIMSAPADGDYSDAAKRPVVTQLPGRITSLSGGGAAFLLEQPLPQQVMLSTEVELPGRRPLRVYCRVVHVMPLARGRCLVRGAFVDMPDETREAIMRYAFHKQQLQAARETGGAGP